MIKIIEANLLDATENVIGHQVNMKLVMGSGVAKQIKNKFPKAYEEYKLLGDIYNLGSCQIVRVQKNKWVANLFGQEGYGRDKQYTQVEALKCALFVLKKLCKENNKSIALPYGIGCGLGGADWNEVYQIIEDVFKDYEVTLYKMEDK